MNRNDTEKIENRSLKEFKHAYSGVSYPDTFLDSGRPSHIPEKHGCSIIFLFSCVAHNFRFGFFNFFGREKN